MENTTETAYKTVNQYVKGRLVCGGVLCHSAPMYLSAYYPNAER